MGRMRMSHRLARLLCSTSLALPLSLLAGCSSGDDGGCRAPGPRPYTAVSDETFVRGPWIAHAAPDALTIGWETSEACRGRLELGRAGQALDLAAQDEGQPTQHLLTASGLRPDTRYTYRLVCGETSAEHTAYTAPEAGDAVRFAVLGDSQSHPEVSSRVLAELEAFEPHLVLHAGDAVGDGQIDALWDLELFAPFGPVQDHLAVYFAMGNHEGHGAVYYRRSAGALLSPESPVATCFAFSAGNLFVLVVDTEHAFFPIADVDTPISTWIKQVAESPAARAATWRVAIGHEPALAEGWSPGACEPPDTFDGLAPVRTWLLPYLAGQGFQAYFAGHTHAYERGVVAGVHTFITGGGGGTLDEHCRDLPEIEVFRAVHHHLRVSADCEAMTVQAWALDETEPFDEVVIPAPAPLSD
jgi:acid phosphatase type 7